ncbi:glycosyltransferase family 4 protein [Amycolatopsis sp. NPDC003865]
MTTQDTRTASTHDPLTVLRGLTPGADPVRVDAVRRAFHPDFAGPALVEYAGVLPRAGDPDGALAALRALTRGTRRPGADDVLAAVPETGDAALDDLAGSVAFDLFADAVVTHGLVAAGAAIGTAFAGSSPRRGALLLDLAERHGIHSLSVDAVTRADAGDRGYRHAVWRYLSQFDRDPAATEVLAAAHIRTADPYERALSAVCLARQSGQGFDSPLWRIPAAGRRGLTVVQSMLLGSFDQPGAGASGGLTVLLRHLGTALPRHDGIARVVTLTLAGHDVLADRAALPEADDRGHVVLRLPVDAPGAPAQADLARHRSAIGFLARHLLWLADCTPDVVHVRYSDDGSAAVADAARAMGARTVFTLTADPHRSLAERYGPGSAAARPAARFDLHRVYTADRLVSAADTLLGLPGRPAGELAGYFPQLRGHPEPESVAEGIPVLSPAATSGAREELVIASLFSAHPELPRLDSAAGGLPIVVSVGRLHPVKQQDLLVEAWLTRGLYRESALVLVGGDPSRPTDDEARILARIRRLAAGHPAAAGRLAVLAAMGNEDVRVLEHGLTRRLPAPTPHLYVCPSRKEEFGIAVLEAMDAGLLVLGPRRGGLGHYIDHGRNGLLADTSTLEAFGDALTAFVRGAAGDPVRARAAAAAGRETVARRFGIREVARNFADVYQRTAGTVAPTAVSSLPEPR